MNKKIALGVAAGVVVVLGLIGYLTTPMPVSSGYTAITTVSNQFFVGRAYHAPGSSFIELREPFLLQNVPDAENKNVLPQLVDLSVESYWLPKTIYIQIGSIISQGAVSPESVIGAKLKDYKAPAQTGQAQPPQQAQPQASGTQR